MEMGKPQDPETKQANKLALIEVTRALMPGGNPNYLGMIQYPMIRDLKAQYGEPYVLLIISIMIRDFCGSVNVSRNMNEDQILEAAAELMHSCGTFRLEDYAVMFTMAKKGQLVKNFYERIDLATIEAIADEYYARRRNAKYDMEEQEVERAEQQVVIPKKWDSPEDRRKNGDLDDRVMGMGGALSEMKEQLKKKLGDG